jgi:phosphate uptake regulator
MNMSTNMETRKVQKTGKSTLTVSLPKKWASKNAIGNGSLLFISQSQSGELLLSTNTSEPDLVLKIDIGSKSGDSLIRDIIACYLAGYSTVEISSSQMSISQKKDLHSIVSKLIGPEVLEENVNKMVIQDLLGSEELQPDRALKRIKNMTRSMTQDSITALINRDKELALDVIQRDDEVDRLNLLIYRQFMEILRSRAVQRDVASSLVAFNYMQASANLESMADHASNIAEIASITDHELSGKMAVELSSVSTVVARLMDECISTILNPDVNRANKIINEIAEIRARFLDTTKSTLENSNDWIFIRLAASSSIERMLHHLINIAELAINLNNATLRIDRSE